jgi:DNA-binding transcriptional regulator/RsmH inhibitor MraZ
VVVVFGFGNILEIWDVLKWHDHVRETAKRRVAAISEALAVRKEVRHRPVPAIGQSGWQPV